ncbi:MAG: hypothetical protein KUA37_15100 [Desulfomicrobium sp.]|nr:hypothetical protein [Pseudomonadota bacterium]MBV1713312.1 hypothetical protein [Desulfomicrobium sp.]MBU4570554.1 hypothetical protein [Pseudomonadota bacterium]MBU4593912.1 hypothetical protein [Pseudomonadota bacterium]MBV1721799.1 hypothetical protein [Desulfomicrobium sp.]
MLEIEITELNFPSNHTNIQAIEVNLDSIPEQYDGYDYFIRKALLNSIESDNIDNVSIYVWGSPSNSFMTFNYSIFIGLKGNSKLLDNILYEFNRVKEINTRRCGTANSSFDYLQYHIQEKKIWQPLDKITWYCKEGVSDNKETVDWDDDDETQNQTRTNQELPSRFRIARSDASVGTIRSTIESVFGLPEGSVALCDPSGRPLRADAKIATLRKRWE